MVKIARTMELAFAVAVLVFPVWAGCQQLPSVDVLLDRLDGYTRQYQATLPSLSCDEQIKSQSLNRKGKVTWEVRVEAALREMRTEDPLNPFAEKHEFRRIDGRKARATFRTSQLPFFVEGGFASLVGFKPWEERECFEDVVTPGADRKTVRLEMTAKAKPANAECRKLPPGLRRVVISEPESGRVLHTERTIEPEMAQWDTEVAFGEIDYAPVQLGEKTFWLPQRFYVHDVEDMKRMIATYSNCHRYTGELKLLPSMSAP